MCGGNPQKSPGQKEGDPTGETVTNNFIIAIQLNALSETDFMMTGAARAVVKKFASGRR